MLYISMVCIDVTAGTDLLEVPPLTPTSKEVISQAVKTSFAGFAQERILHHFPKGKTSINHVCEFSAEKPLLWLNAYTFTFMQTLLCGLSGR